LKPKFCHVDALTSERDANAKKVLDWKPIAFNPPARSDAGFGTELQWFLLFRPEDCTNIPFPVEHIPREPDNRSREVD